MDERALRDERSNGCDGETTHGNVFMSDKNEILIDYAHEHLVGLSGPAP